MSQIRIDPNNLKGETFVIEGSEARHVIVVLRRKPGDKVQLFDGQGKQYKGVVHRLDTQNMRVEGRIQTENESHQNTRVIALYQGLPKGAKFDYVIEKASELGVDEVIPFLSEKNVIKMDDQENSPKHERWVRLAEAAAKQCDRPLVPDIQPVQVLKDLKWDKIGGVTLVFDGGAHSKNLKTLWREMNSQWTSAQRFNLIIGPESGFSPRELESLIKAGALPVSLGSLTLRTETAGLVALSLLQYELASH